MSMTPQEIQEKHFHDTFRGYSHEEVDLFLDEVAVAFERLYRENQSFMRRVVDLEEQLKKAQESAGTQPARSHEAFDEDPGVTESTLKRMLLIAQETADRAVQEARQRARDIQEQARTRADEMMEHAERRVRELSSQRMEKEKELERAKEALRRFDEQYRASFRVFIESQLAALKDLPATPPGSFPETAAETPAASDRPSASPRARASFVEPGQKVKEAPSAVGMETMAIPAQPIEAEASGIGEPEGGTGEAQPLSGESPDEAPEAPSSAGSGQVRQKADREESEVNDDPALVRTPKSEIASGQPAMGPKNEEEGRDAHPAAASESRAGKDRKGARAGESSDSDAEEDRLIRELFWGDDD